MGEKTRNIFGREFQQATRINHFHLSELMLNAHTSHLSRNVSLPRRKRAAIGWMTAEIVRIERFAESSGVVFKSEHEKRF